MSPTVRPGESTDLDDLVDLVDRSTAELAGQRGGEAFLASLGRRASTREFLTAAIEDETTMVWCGVWEGVVVGYAIAALTEETGSPIVVLSDIYTLPEARDVGVGEVLCEAAIAWAIASEAYAIDAHALPGARASKNLYERLGLTARLITVRRELP